MAIFAREHRMRADERKAIQVIADVFVRDLPALHGMAVFAVCTELPAMNVCVAVRTVLAHVFEDQARVTFGAGHLLVHAAQRVACLIVIEFGVGTNGLPTRVGVTLLACSGDGSVRICDLGLWSASHLRTRALCGFLQAHGCKQRRSNQQQKELALTIHPLLRVLPPGSTSCDRLREKESVSAIKRNCHGTCQRVQAFIHPELVQ